MKVLFINPSQTAIYGGLPAPLYSPLGLGYLAAVLLKEGHEVQIIDIDAERVQEADLKRRIIQSNPSLIGVTTTTPTFPNALALARLIKEISEAYVVLGGVHPTVCFQEVISQREVDFVVRGEGEETIRELAIALENSQDLAKVPGLVYKENGSIRVNEERKIIEDLDVIPFPARHLFRTPKYTYPDALSSPAMPIITSRGCPGRCTFCNTQKVFGPRFRARSAQNVADEVEHLIERFKVREIHIWDDNFTTLKKRVFEIRDEIRRRNIQIKFAFPNGVRPDYIGEEILKALKEMGTYSIALGIESGSQKILDRAKKGFRLEQVEEAFRLTKKFGLETWGFFILGLPGETEETAQETIDFARRLNPDIAKFHILSPYPGTEVFEELSREGLLTSRDYSRYGIHTRPVHRLPDLSEEELLLWQKRAYRKFYLKPSKVINHLLRMKSLNRIKLNLKMGLSILRRKII